MKEKKTRIVKFKVLVSVSTKLSTNSTKFNAQDVGNYISQFLDFKLFQSESPQFGQSILFQHQELLTTNLLKSPVRSYLIFTSATRSKPTGLEQPTVLITEGLVTCTIINSLHNLPMGQSWENLLKVMLIHVGEVFPTDSVFYL